MMHAAKRNIYDFTPALCFSIQFLLVGFTVYRKIKTGLGIVRYFYCRPLFFVKVDAKSTLGQAILGLCTICMVELPDPHHSQCRIRSCSWPEHRLHHLTERLKWAKECEDCKGNCMNIGKPWKKTTRQISTMAKKLRDGVVSWHCSAKN